MKDNRAEHAAQLQLSASANSGKNDPVQREAVEEEELQMKSVESSPPAIQNPLAAPIQRTENKTGLPDQLKSGVENLSGYSLDDVNVHYNSSKPSQLQAHAYAQGSDIHVAPGQEQHLPHEAWHVVQQKQGRVKATRQLKGAVNINDDAGLENEADVMGAKALGSSTHAIQSKLASKGVSRGMVQRVEEEARPVYDEKMTELVEQTKAIIAELGKKGRNWENEYRIKGKEKAKGKTRDLLDGKKDDTNYGKEALKKIWGELTTQEKLEVAKAVGGSLWDAVKSTGSVISDLPSLDLGSSGEDNVGKKKEKVVEKEKEKPKKSKKEDAPEEGRSLVSRALSEVTLEDAQNAYKVYREYGRLREKIDEAMDKIVETAGEAGEETGAFFGSLRDKKEFSDLCEDQKRSFLMARKRLEVLKPQVAGDPRYNDEIDALEDALTNVIHGPGKVYWGLTGAWDTGYRQVCEIALGNLNTAQQTRSGLGSGVKRLGRFLGLVPESSQPSEKAQKPIAVQKPDSLGAAQAAMLSKMTTVTNKGWGSKTFFFFTPKGVSEIKSELSKASAPAVKIAKIKALAQSYGKLESSGNRSAETQILYDALANVDETNLNSVWAATSKIDDVIGLI